MAKNLPDNIDEFFLNNLKDYTEKPENNIWDEISKRLSEKKDKRKAFVRKITGLGVAAIFLCLLIPFTLKDVHVDQKLNKTNPKKDNYISHVQKQNNARTSSGINQKIKVKDFLPENSLTIADKNKSTENKSAGRKFFTSADVTAIIGNSLLPGKELMKQVYPLYIPNHSLINNNKVAPVTNQNNSNKNSVPLSYKKHSIELIPFFSFDHISGRFKNEYKFNNEDEDDYNNREKPDISFTGGLLASYRINKRFSLLSGVSVSYASVSISSTAVKALQDASGVYKFRLATSYGFAEISKTGIIPAAGDSLIVATAMMQLNYISFPALIKYDVGGKKIKWSIHAGVALNKVMSDKVQTEYIINNYDDNETVNKIEGVRRTFFTVNTGVEAKYSINHFLDIGLSPELRYGINAINKGTPVKTYPVNYGLAANIHIKL